VCAGSQSSGGFCYGLGKLPYSNLGGPDKLIPTGILVRELKKGKAASSKGEFVSTQS